MARIPEGENGSIHTISKWLGVNENADGDTNMRLGEASAMSNFKITSDGSLQKRPGTKEVYSLLSDSDYRINIATTLTTVLTEKGLTSTARFSCQPTASVNDEGVLKLSGDITIVTYANIAAMAGQYCLYKNGIYKIDSCLYTVPTGTAVSGGYVITKGDGVSLPGVTTLGHTITVYPTVAVSSGAVGVSGTPETVNFNSHAAALYKYTVYNGIVYFIMGESGVSNEIGAGYMFGGIPVIESTDATYAWKFYKVTRKANTSGNDVQGIWAGRVGATDGIYAACNGYLWSVSKSGEGWTRTQLDLITTTGRVHFFGFDGKLYIMNGTEYKVYNGSVLSTVEGYRPLVAVSVPPAGGGTSLQRINMLNGLRRIWISPTGSATTFKLPEASLSNIDYVKNLASGTNYAITTDYTINTAAGTVIFAAAPAAGTNTIEIGYAVSSAISNPYRTQILAMKLSETYNGTSDSRVFIYGDGTNKAFYSDLDYNGKPRADYFPDLNVVHFGDSGTPLTSLIRHYDRLLAFKSDSAYSVYYDTITLVSGSVTAGFYVTTVNKGIGCAGYGQAVVVDNHPRTLDGRAIYEWIASTSSGNITSDQRNAQRISQKVETTLREIDLDTAMTYYDKVNHEYYIVQNGVAIVQNTENNAWYVYRDFPALCMIVYNDDLYFGTADGAIRRVSRDYLNDEGEPITCYWESGSMDFGAYHMKKYSDMIWIVLKPESNASINVTVRTDKNSDGETPRDAFTCNVSTGLLSFDDLDFANFTFNVNDKPQTQRRKIMVKNFAWYKLILSSVSNDTTATMLDTAIKVRMTGKVR